MISLIKKAEEAHKRRELFIEFHSKSRILEMQMIYEIEKNKDYKILGFNTFADYCHSPIESGGLDISRAWATQLARVYQKYCIELEVSKEKLAKLSPRKLYQLRKVATKENLEEIITKVENVSLEDLGLLDKEVVNCQHKNLLHQKQFFWAKCPDCKQNIKLWLKDIKERIQE